MTGLLNGSYPAVTGTFQSEVYVSFICQFCARVQQCLNRVGRTAAAGSVACRGANLTLNYLGKHQLSPAGSLRHFSSYCLTSHVPISFKNGVTLSLIQLVNVPKCA